MVSCLSHRVVVSPSTRKDSGVLLNWDWDWDLPKCLLDQGHHAAAVDTTWRAAREAGRPSDQRLVNGSGSRLQLARPAQPAVIRGTAPSVKLCPMSSGQKPQSRYPSGQLRAGSAARAAVAGSQAAHVAASAATGGLDHRQRGLGHLRPTAPRPQGHGRLARPTSLAIQTNNLGRSDEQGTISS